ncbi:amidohydrolase [Actinoplanes couchii]|uniref:Amidohydrolase n=1 Tax=Actinoplanes couchii TaxID=403638 RepID=A0ABQ3XLJ8_9ACTN|nr:amidohydrolase [Actinoplanes couchii]MDR6318255.1 putative amidohydrolase YtcJ [Actinoplanes couchii]GID59374.1 amidohydrolase [Actinoplanes couchii]
MITADLLLTNARFLTMDGPDTTALSILNGRIVALEEVPARETVDLGGATVVPGFHDAHNHMAWYGLSLAEVDLRLDSMDAVLAALTGADVPEGRWLVGSGYDENKIGRHPTRDDLDRIAPGRPAWLRHVSGHMCVVNSAVLRMLGLDERGRDVDGGLVVLDDTGRPTGLLQEQAQNLVNELVLPYPLHELTDAIDRAGQRYLAEGITSVTEAGIGGGWIGKSPVELAAYQAARDQGRLRVRTELMVAADALHPLTGHADDGLSLGLDLGIRTGFGDDWLRIGPVKVFTDGSLIGHTAALCHDYADRPGSGYLQGDADALTATIVRAHRSGWRVAAHAIGDAAIDLALDAYERAQRELPRPDARHRIEHFGVARHDQVERAVRLGVIGVPQARFVPEIGDGMLAALGPQRAGDAYRLRSLLDAGMVLPGSSDRPVTIGAPLLGIQAMVDRTTASGQPFSRHEQITPREALRAYTLGSAFASHREHVTGSLTVGKLADLAVLADDPTSVDTGSIGQIQVLRTMIGGQWRWN